MVTTIKVLKRKDAASLVVAIVLGLIISSLLAQVTGQLSAKLSGTSEGVDFAFKSAYAYPILSAALQLLALEVLLWLYGAAKGSASSK